VLLGGDSGGLMKLLSGKNSALMLTLLPLVLGMLGSKSGSQSGLEDVIGSLTSGGLGDIVNSWVGKGPNKSITKGQVKKHVGKKALDQLSQQSGLSTDQVASGLSTLLPVLVNHLTPQGQVPGPSALDSALQGLSGLLPK